MIRIIVLLILNQSITAYGQVIKDITQEFMSSKDITVNESGCIAYLNQSMLNGTFVMFNQLPKNINALLLIVEVNRTTIEKLRNDMPCGYVKIGIHKAGDRYSTYLQKDLIEYNFEVTNSKQSIFYKTINVGPKNRIFVMKYTDARCKASEYTHMTIITIPAIVYDSDCQPNQCRIEMENKSFCVWDNEILRDKLQLINVNCTSTETLNKTEHSDVEENKLPIIIIVIGIIAVVVIIAVIITIILVVNRFKKQRQDRIDYTPINKCSPNAVQMQYKCNTKCIILCNKHYDADTTNRRDSTVMNPDVVRLKQTLEKFDIVVNCFEDKTVEDIKDLIKNIQPNDEDIVILFVLTHQKGKRIFGTCCNSLTQEELLEPWLSHPDWKAIPKLVFLIQHYRYDKPKSNAVKFSDEDNFFFVTASSARADENQKSTSIFVENLCLKIETAAENDEIEEMIRSVIKESKEKIRKENYSFHQYLHCCGTLREQLTFSTIFRPKKQSRCFIIANEQFQRTTNLTAENSTKSDKELLERTFQSLQFKIDLRENESAEDMKKIFKDLTNINTECLFVFIMSHGFGGTILGSCGVKITLNDLLNPLLSNQSWKDVPKVVFLIGCSEEDHRKNFNSLTFPFEENCYIGIATSANRKGTNEPSFFVQDLCEAIKESQNGDIFKLTVDKARFCTERNLAMNGYPHNQHPEFMYSLKICLKTVSYFNDKEEIKTIKSGEEYGTVNGEEQNPFDLDEIGLESYELSKSKPRGLCLILYNDEFNDRHLSPLPWIKHDVELIENTFDKLGYEIQTAKNKSVNDMKKFVEDIDFHPEYDSLFLFVLSHGVNGEIYGSQGGEIHIVEFQLNCCSNLEGKPKFIIVICSQSGSNFNKLTVPYIPDTLVVYTTHLQASEFHESNEMDDQQHLPNERDDLLSSNNTDDLPSLDKTTTYFLKKFCNLIVNERNRNIRLLFQSASNSTHKMIIRRNYNLAKRTFHYVWLNKKFSIGDDNYISNDVNSDQIPRDNVEFEQ